MTIFLIFAEPAAPAAIRYCAQQDRTGGGGDAGGADRSGADRGGWIFYPLTMTLVSPRGKSVFLSAKEMRLVVYLLACDPQPVTRATFALILGGEDQARQVDATVYRLRKKIQRETGLRPPLRTVYGIGYQNDGIQVFGPLPDLI